MTHQKFKIKSLFFNPLILIYRGLDKVQEVLLTHGDSIEKVADSFKPIAQSQAFIAGISNEKLNLFGVQFHPEVKLNSPENITRNNTLHLIPGRFNR